MARNFSGVAIDCAWSLRESRQFLCYADAEWAVKRRIFVEQIRQSENQIKTAWPYSSVPLHFVDMGWPLYQLGLLQSGAFLMRIPMNWSINRYGDWRRIGHWVRGLFWASAARAHTKWGTCGWSASSTVMPKQTMDSTEDG